MTRENAHHILSWPSLRGRQAVLSPPLHRLLNGSLRKRARKPLRESPDCISVSPFVRHEVEASCRKEDRGRLDWLHHPCSRHATIDFGLISILHTQSSKNRMPTISRYRNDINTFSVRRFNINILTSSSKVDSYSYNFGLISHLKISRILKRINCACNIMNFEWLHLIGFTKSEWGLEIPVKVSEINHHRLRNQIIIAEIIILIR